MTSPGRPPPRGRHAAPDEPARPDDVAPAGRHAAADPARRRHAAPEPDGDADGPPRRRHAAPDDPATGVVYHRPTLSNGIGYRRPEPSPTGLRAPGTNPVDYAGPQSSGVGSAGGPGQHRPEPSRTGYGPSGTSPVDYAWPQPSPEGAGANGGRHRPDRYAAPGATGGWHRRAEPDAGDATADGFGYHRPRPGAHRYGGAEAAPHPWPEVDGYHLDSPAPPAVNGYRLDEPVAPVTGFPYTAPPAPTGYPVNGHGVDAAERDAASWPANGAVPAWPIGGYRTELDRPADPQIAVVPLTDEPTEVLDRPAAPRPATRPATGTPPAPQHPPRAVVRRRRARRKALEWPLLIVFAVISAFLIRQYVVQTFYIPSASMHETLVEGDRVLVNKVGYHLHDINRGDVVVFRKPPNLNVSEDDLIKRVVALPGETVEGRGGKVYINGAPLAEPYVEPLCHGTGQFAKVTVPAGMLWVMGDNRCNSSDSRVFGPIDENLVVGRAFVLAWPFDRLSWL